MGGRLEDRVAVITGGASGMGRATALRFLDEGARVVIADLNEGSAKETLEAAAARGAADRIRFLRADVSQEDDVQGMVQLALREFGRLDCVFNNAGLGGALGPITDTELEDWDYTFAVLVRGVFLGIKHGAPAIRAGGRGGAIVNTASVAGLSGGAGPAAYSAAKAAVINLTRSAAVELAPDRIRVNAICPGAISTPLLHRGHEAALLPRLAKAQPWGEAGRPEHVAGAALFLASDDAAFVTGEALVVDGGLTAAGPDLRARLASQPELDQLRVVGLDRGTTGQPPLIRKVGV
jgi:NAD(P)-dependent dehydrogenase (short-subunit alcohol dehydrogenase family)